MSSYQWPMGGDEFLLLLDNTLIAIEIKRIVEHMNFFS
jgi:hypothetical protein